MKTYRTEHPNPQFERDDWQCLNGEWDFGFKKAVPGFKFSADESAALKIRGDNNFPTKINVPFCIESSLSKIGFTDFVNMVWYRKKVDIKKGSKRVFLHIGAADYLTTVLINGKAAGRHKGGYTSFSFDITELIKDGEKRTSVRGQCKKSFGNARKAERAQKKPRLRLHENHGNLAERVFGIRA